MPCDQPRRSPGEEEEEEAEEREEPRRPRKRKAKGKAKRKAEAASSSSSSAAAPSPARGSKSPMEEGVKEPGARAPQDSPRGEEDPFLFPAWEEGSGDENALVIHSQAEEEAEVAAAFKCLLCGESFGQQPGLLRHQKQHHAGERTFVCAECGKGFGLKHNLIIHQRIHTGEKPFGCGACGKRFSLKQNLLTHQRVHGDGRPAACAACGKSFREQRLLLAHQKGGCGVTIQEKPGTPARPQPHPRGRHRPESTGRERLGPRPLRAKAPEKPHANGTCREGGHPKTRPIEEGRRGLGQKEGPGSPKPRLRSEDAAFQSLTCGKNFAQRGKLAAHGQSHQGQGMPSPS